MSVKKEAEDILENVQEAVTGKVEAESILENIQPPLTLGEINEKTEKLARSLTWNRVGFCALGLAVGGVAGYFVTKRLLKTKYSKIADEEIAEMRNHYLEKARAAEAAAAKRPVEEIVQERGYSPSGDRTNTPPPMVVQPPESSQREMERIESEDEAAGEPPDEPEAHNIFQEVEPVEHEWDYHEELKRRSPDIPYVIHYDERQEMGDAYHEVTLTYYEGDDVLCNERDDIVDPDERDNVVGEGNLDRFGHGSNDPSIVYIRNDKLEIVYEVIRSPHRFAEEVHGFRHYGYGKNLERMRARERDEQEE